MPVQLRRILLVFALFIAIMLVLRHFLKPKTFGDLGHYRADALIDIAAKEPKYTDAENCIMCHDSIGKDKEAGQHNLINCQTCHGSGGSHINEPEKNKMIKPEGRAFCARCHEKNPARPNGIIKQIDPAEHNKEEVCISCHNPHKP